MAICVNCRIDSGSGRFCAACGTPVGPPVAAVQSADLPENAASLLCYALWALTGVVFLVLEPYNRSKLVRFHAWQSILTSIVLFVGWFAVLTAASILRLLPWIGVPLALIVLNAFGLAILGLWILLMFKAYQGGSLDLPFISRFAQKQA
jgi:uncharacterized membrane protein